MKKEKSHICSLCHQNYQPQIEQWGMIFVLVIGRMTVLSETVLRSLLNASDDSAASARERISWKMLTNLDKGMNSSKVRATWLIFSVLKSYAALPLKIMADVICLCLFLSGKEFKIVRHSTSFQLIINISVDIGSMLIMTFSSLMPENNDYEYKLWIDSKRVWHGNSNLNFKVGSLRDN